MDEIIVKQDAINQNHSYMQDRLESDDEGELINRASNK